jgi:KaiC/GvpD/RAD55 family RecA-like ATPase
MSSVVRLPEELRKFLQLPGPQSMLIRGPPGSGKSTLGLALLEAASGTRVLLTNRVSSAELAREFPWLGENGSTAIQVVDASEMEISLHGISNAAAQATIAYEPGSHEKESLSEFLTLPPPVQEAYSRLPSDGPSTLVVDSWDALVEHFLGRRSRHAVIGLDRAELERMLLRWMARSPTHLILVLETEAQTQLDYLVNGVVVTRREQVNDRLERWLFLPKLRGIRIGNASYPYTVEGAKFQCIEPLRPYSKISRGQVEPESDPLPGFMWPGSRSFAEAFGRLPVGGLTLLELGEDVPEEVVQHLLYPAKVHALRTGGRVLVIPSSALSADDIWGPIEEARLPGHLSDVFRVLDVSGQLERGLRGGSKTRLASLISLRSMPAPDPARDPDDNEISRWLKGGVVGGPPGLVTMSGSGVESLAIAMKTPITAEVAASLPASLRATLGQNHLHLIAIIRSQSTLLAPVRSLASIHIRLLDRQGRVLIYGLKPWTPGFVLTESANSGPYEMLRIV